VLGTYQYMAPEQLEAWKSKILSLTHDLLNR